MSRRLWILFVFALFQACSACGEESGASSSSGTITVNFLTSGGTVMVTAELADNEAERETGLMGREHLSEDAGMLFVFDDEATRSFWMKDTLIPLDMIFLSAAREIVYIEENTTPFSLASISPETPARYVVEVNGGFCSRYGVAVGDGVAFTLP